MRYGFSGAMIGVVALLGVCSVMNGRVPWNWTPKAHAAPEEVAPVASPGFTISAGNGHGEVMPGTVWLGSGDDGIYTPQGQAAFPKIAVRGEPGLAEFPAIGHNSAAIGAMPAWAHRESFAQHGWCAGQQSGVCTRCRRALLPCGNGGMTSGCSVSRCDGKRVFEGCLECLSEALEGVSSVTSAR